MRYQTLENKQKFISQIMTSKSPVRSCDDVDEQALSYAEIKALCAGNPLIKEKMDLDIDVARLKVLKADHQSQQYRMEDKLLKYFPAEIEKQTGYIHGFEADIKTVEAHPQIADGFCGMEIMGKAYTEKADAGEILLAACKDTKSADPVPLGSYRGFQMELSFDSFRNEFDVTLKGAMSHRVRCRKKNTRPGTSGQQKCSRRLWKPVTMIFFVWLLTLPSPVPCEWVSFWGLPGTVLTFPLPVLNLVRQASSLKRSCRE